MSIGVAQVRKGLKRAVKERGYDYLYEMPDKDAYNASCLYVHDGDEPGCIVGLVLHRLGVPLANLRAGGDMNRLPIHMRSDLDLTEAARTMLQDAQTHQDNGRTWGQAVDVAFARDAQRSAKSN